MNCEEFANAGLDVTAKAAGPDSEAAREHLRTCPECAALQERLLELRGDLQELGETTAQAGTPSRVEMRLRQEFRTRHKTDKNRDRAVVAGWLLAAATMVLVAGSVVMWQQRRVAKIARVRESGPAVQSSPSANPAPSTAGVEESPATPVPSQTRPKERRPSVVASRAWSEFTLLPDSVPGLLDDSTVVRVRLQRGALGAFGLPVSEERATDWIQVDLLVAADGQPQALRLPQTTIN